MFTVQTGAWRGTGPRPTVKAAIRHGEGLSLALRCGDGVFFRSAGASDAIRASERVSPALSIVPMCVSPSVVCARLITNGSGSGTPYLQG